MFNVEPGLPKEALLSPFPVTLRRTPGISLNDFLYLNPTAPPRVLWQYLAAYTDDFIALWLFREYNVDLKIGQRRVQHEKPIEGVVQSGALLGQQLIQKLIALHPIDKRTSGQPFCSPPRHGSVEEVTKGTC
ncbi:hypothetical protein [Mesorhizobium sp.]|uniref:hypothetical protein n=1 Tax=Mesorhizobium sp. TaxID=1871066 RepID=UPI0025BB4D8F|nr:hypothetical protein [Mesorhizobium sp.]